MASAVENPPYFPADLCVAPHNSCLSFSLFLSFCFCFILALFYSGSMYIFLCSCIHLAVSCLYSVCFVVFLCFTFDLNAFWGFIYLYFVFPDADCPLIKLFWFFSFNMQLLLCPLQYPLPIFMHQHIYRFIINPLSFSFNGNLIYHFVLLQTSFQPACLFLTCFENQISFSLSLQLIPDFLSAEYSFCWPHFHFPFPFQCLSTSLKLDSYFLYFLWII